ncbi:MAG: amidohydrolase family protein [Balneola sp.]
MKAQTLIPIVLCSLMMACTGVHEESDITAIKGATIFDGNGDSFANGVIVTNAGVIDCVGEESNCSIPSGAKVIDASGKYVTPGLVDAHMHFFQTAFFDSRPDALDLNETYPISEVTAYQRQNPQRYYNSYLCSGITAVYDVDDEFIQLAKENGTYYNPTLVVGSGYTVARRAAADIEAFKILDPNGCVDDKTRTLLETAAQFKDHPRLTENVKNRLRQFDPETDRVSKQQLRNLKRLYDEGVKIVVGTDAGNPGTLHGISIYEEMEAMQSAGIAPEDLIVMATKNGAESMRRGNDFGTLEKGKFANLIIMDSDPSEDISNMKTITHTMIKGKLMKVDEIVKE